MPNAYGFSDRDLTFIFDTIRRYLEKDQHPELWLFGSRVYKVDLVQEAELYAPYKSEVDQQKIFLAKL